MSTGARIAGFTAAVGATAALVGFGASTTGAYFTDSHAGAVNASTGGVHVNVSDLQLNFTQLLPGEFQTRNVSYQATGSGLEDIWLVLPATGAEAFNGVPAPGPNPLGRYGHFAVDSPAGSFTSFNLASGASPCTVDANGHGGSNAQAADRTDFSVPYCPVPTAILLSSGLAYGDTGTAAITFGFTKLLHAAGAQDQPNAPVAQFQIVATQHGIAPNDPNN